MILMINKLVILLLAFKLTLSEEDEASKLPVMLTSNHPKANDYLCTSVPLPETEQYLVGYEPSVTPGMVHHMLLYGCAEPYSDRTAWDCKNMGGTCKAESGKILYVWANNAEGLQLPEGVGYRVGQDAGIRHLVVQLHFGNPNRSSDTSGLTVSLTKTRPQYSAGVYLIIGSSSIRQGESTFDISGACRYDNTQAITPFAYRVHAHSRCTQITGFSRQHDESTWEVIGNRSPQDPQAFYPVISNTTIHKEDYVAARCIYNTSEDKHVVNIGSDTTDEMCNFYIMYYTTNDGKTIANDICGIGYSNNFYGVQLPAISEVALPLPDDPTHSPAPHPPQTENSTDGDTSSITVHTLKNLQLAHDWALNGKAGKEAKPLLSVPLGQVTAVDVCREGDLYVFHRGNRIWDESSFDMNDRFLQKDDGPIAIPTILHLSSTGGLLGKYGANKFYLPHGLTVDSEGNIWLTDVAMHQVFKFGAQRLLDGKPELTLGVAFEPGNDLSHFCKPAAVAVETSGNFYVADGYCNRRVIKFSKFGGILQVFKSAVDGKQMFVPHSLALINSDSALLVADRENSRIITLATSNMSVLSVRYLSHPVYAVAAPKDTRDTPLMYAVFEATQSRGVNGSTIYFNGTEEEWGPQGGFAKAHDVSASGDGSAVYVAEIGPNRIWKFVPESYNHAGKVRNRTIGIRPPNSTEASNNNSENVKVQDETNMPKADWEDDLHHDKVNDTEIHEDCPQSVPPENCHKATPDSGLLPDENGFGNKHHKVILDEENDNCTVFSYDAECIHKSPLMHYGGIALGVAILVAIILVLCLSFVYVCWKLQCCNRCSSCKRKNLNISKKAQKAKENLHSLLGPSHQGFVRVRTFDSESEAEDVIFEHL